MNFIEALRNVLAYASNYLDIVPCTAQNDADIIAVAQILSAYDALAPDWAQAPDWANWCAINANGLRYWFDVEPLAMHGATGWVNRGDDKQSFYEQVQLPAEIAWTVCKWQRPTEAQS